MNKRRLLLLSVFALLHITTSERNFIDGRYRCCNHSSRYLSFENDFITSEPYRVQRLLPEIRTLNTPKNPPISSVRDSELPQLSIHRQIRYIKQRSQDNEIRDTFAKQRNKILTRHSEEIPGGKKFQEIIVIRNNALQNDFRHNRYDRFRIRDQRDIQTTSFSRNDKEKNIVTRNRIENRDVSRYNYNDRVVRSRTTRNSRNGIKPSLPKQDERDTQRYTNRDIMRKTIEDVQYMERKAYPQKLTLETNDRHRTNLQSFRITRSNKENVHNQLATDRNSRLESYRNLNYKELSQNELLRKTFVRNNVESNERMNFKNNKRDSFSDNEINKRLVISSRDTMKSLTENRQRSERIHNRGVSVINRGTRDFQLELRETSRRQRNHIENRHETAIRTQSDRRPYYNGLNIHHEMENRLNHRRSFSEEILRDVQTDRRIQLDRKINNIDRDGRINVKPNMNRKMSSRPYTKETNKRMKQTFEARLNNKERYYEGNNIRNVNENSLSVRRKYNEGALEGYNERIARRDLSMEKFRERYELRRSQGMQRSINDISDKILRRNREKFNLAPEIRKRDESRLYLRDDKFLNEINLIENSLITKRRERQQPDYRRGINHNRILNNNNIRRSYENEFRLSVREDQNRITLRMQRLDMKVKRDLQIVRTNFEDDYLHQSRSVSNEKDSTNNPQDTRQTDVERRYTKKTEERRPINIRQVATLRNEKRYSMMELSDSRGSRTHKITYDNNVFEIKWQYLFYMLQFVYLCSILIQTSKNNEESKHKNRVFSWLTTPAECLKID